MGFQHEALDPSWTADLDGSLPVLPRHLPRSTVLPLNLQTLNTRKLYFPATGGRFLVTGKDCPAQTGHNDFEHTKESGPGFFVITTGFQAANLWVADGSNKGVNLPDKRKLCTEHCSWMREITITPNSVFFGHGFLQHAGAAWSGTNSIRHHIYLIPDGHPLKDALSFAYGWSFKKEGDTSSHESRNSSGGSGVPNTSSSDKQRKPVQSQGGHVQED